MNFGKKLKDLRKRKRLTQAGLAEVLGVSLKTVRNYEGGFCYPKQRDTYYILSDFFDIDVNYLLTDSEIKGEEFLSEPELKDRGDLLISEARALFFNPDLSSTYKKKIADTIHELYFEARYGSSENTTQAG